MLTMSNGPRTRRSEAVTRNGTHIFQPVVVPPSPNVHRKGWQLVTSPGLQSVLRSGTYMFQPAAVPTNVNNFSKRPCPWKNFSCSCLPQKHIKCGQQTSNRKQLCSKTTVCCMMAEKITVCCMMAEKTTVVHYVFPTAGSSAQEQHTICQSFGHQ